MIMALLKRKSDNPVDTIERERNDLVARREVLEQNFDRAHAVLAEATNERRTSLLDADLSDEEACRRRDQLCRDARDRVEALGDAISQIGSKISDAEAKLAGLRAEAEQQEHARAVRHIADRLETETAAFADGDAKIIPLVKAGRNGARRGR
jgi:phage shock protein A